MRAPPPPQVETLMIRTHTVEIIWSIIVVLRNRMGKIKVFAYFPTFLYFCSGWRNNLHQHSSSAPWRGSSRIRLQERHGIRFRQTRRRGGRWSPN